MTRTRGRTRSWMACVMGVWPLLAQAQLHLPEVNVPPLPANVRAAVEDVSQSGALSTVTTPLRDVRRTLARGLIRSQRRVIAADRNGEPIIKDQILALAPTDTARAMANALGFTVLNEVSIGGLGLPLVTLKVPARLSMEQALRALRAADPTGAYDFNHIYIASGEAGQGSAAVEGVATPGVAPPATITSSNKLAASRSRIGLIDTGIDLTHPAFRRASVLRFGCNGTSRPAAHGTAVASLLVGDAPQLHGAAQGAELYAADVYCDAATGGAVDTLAGAFGWMLAKQVPIINVSLVGPDNATLARIVAALVAHGEIIVAAVGNDGPAAPPLYPAAYPGVIGVTGVDEKRHVLLEAERGMQVMFAARGSMAAAALNQRYAPVRGTSFAAPVVAAILVRSLSSGTAPSFAVSKLASQAIDLGEPGRDLTYGFGLVGADIFTSVAE